MPNKLDFYLHQSQNDHGLWDLFQRTKPPVILIHQESKNDILLTQMREWRSPDTFVVGRLGLSGEQQRALLDDPDPEAAGRRLADRIFNQDRSFLLKRYPNQPSGRLLVDAWMSLNECVEGPAWEERPNQSAQWQEENLARHRRYDRFQVAFRRRLREFIPDVETVAFNFGAGNFKTAQQYIDLYPETLQEYTYLGLHEYGWPAMAAHLTTRPVKTNAGRGAKRDGAIAEDMRVWFERGAQGYMQWGFMATDFDNGDGDRLSGMDRGIHHDDWEELYRTYRTVAGDLEQRAGAMPPAPHQPAPASGFKAGQTVYTTKGVNLRSSPDASSRSNIVAEVPGRSAVTILGESTAAGGFVWWRVRISRNGAAQEGWMAQAVGNTPLLSLV